ncbi:MAG: hypothetical protein K5695_03735 [Oscillospiraceae bacterium]|nr:hypothetical protein [Oscillospiraceae bacterium]
MTATEFLTQLDAALLGLTRDERENALEYYREYFADAGADADAAAENLGSPQSVAERIIAEADGTAEPGLAAQQGIAPQQTAAQQQSYTTDYGYGAGTSYSGTGYSGTSYSAGTSYSSGTGYTTDYGYSGTSYGTDYGYTTPPYSGSSSTDGAHIVTFIVVMLLTLPIWITVYSLWLTLVVTLFSLIISFGVGAPAGLVMAVIQFAHGDAGAGVFLIGSALVCAGLTMLLWKPFWLACKYSTVGLFALSKKIILGLLGR